PPSACFSRLTSTLFLPSSPPRFLFWSRTPFFFCCSGHPPHLHSFPTRRSSDLDRGPLHYLLANPPRDLLPGQFVLQRPGVAGHRSEEHTSELQSRENLVCRLLLEKKKELETDTHFRMLLSTYI